MTMFPHRGIVADLCNSLFPMGLRNTETRYFVLCSDQRQVFRIFKVADYCFLSTKKCANAQLVHNFDLINLINIAVI